MTYSETGRYQAEAPTSLANILEVLSFQSDNGDGRAMKLVKLKIGT